MRPDYKQWLEKHGYDPGTITAQLHRVGRVEEHYGGLDGHFSKDHVKSLSDELRYSTEDSRRHRPNPSKIHIHGDLRNNLSSYRSAVALYVKFLSGETTEDAPALVSQSQNRTEPIEIIQEAQRLTLERDLQMALRRDIGALENGLRIIDQGLERIVPSGRIDITAEGADGALVVIEIKAGTATRHAIGQILSYMGDVSAIDAEKQVRGLLVASDFDSGALAAARIVPSIELRRYSIRFQFSEAVA